MISDIQRIPILTYHKITDRREMGLNTVPPRLFDRQMELLRELNYSPITFRDVSRGNVPPKPVIITFDDGYTSVFENALPVLEKFGYSAVIFIITGYIGRDNTWDVNLGGIKFPHLTAEQIKDLADQGMEIGSHGTTHRAFTFLPEEQVSGELKESVQEISTITGNPPLTVAYPFGIQNKTVRELARHSGFRYGCINMWGSVASADPMCLRRIPVYRTDTPGIFRMKLSSGWKNSIERVRLRMISFPALLTPVYQKYFKKIC